MNVKSRIAAAAAAAALAGGITLAPAGSAAASTSAPVTIQGTVILGPFTGTWSASGGINDSGTLTEPTDFLVDHGQVHIVRVMTGSMGTITLVIDLSLTAGPDGTIVGTGPWAVIAGTGAYPELRGHGTDRGVVAKGVVTETLTGSVHFDQRPSRTSSQPKLAARKKGRSGSEVFVTCVNA
jgi:hypothetical protein